MAAIYTRTGDKGTTGLFGGTRVPKQDPTVEAYGTLDEANATIGEAKARVEDPDMRAALQHIQQRLFVAAAELASDEAGRAVIANTISPDDVADLERLIDDSMAETGPQRNFVVPGRDLVSAALHRARTVTRRAERRMLTAAESRPVRPELIRYVNRLSDALYSLARVAEHRFDVARLEGLVRSVVEKHLAAQSRQPRVAWSPASGFVPADVSTTADPATRFGLARYDLDVLQAMAAAAQSRGAELGVPIVFAGVDAGGHLMLLHRMEDSLLGSLDLASNKAFTAAAFKQPTADLSEASLPGAELHGIQNSNDGRVVVFGGGLPVFVDGVLCGGIGVSGGTVDQDVTIASFAMSRAKEASRS